MTEHIATDRMHEIVDGAALSTDPGGELEHLDACEACAMELEALSDVVRELRGLPTEAVAPDGLWSGIEAWMGDRGPATVPPDVLPMARSPLRIVFSVPQLAAAALVVSLMSAGTVWMALGGSGAPAPQVADAPAEWALSHASRAASGESGGYAAAVSELETLVIQGRDLLAPETLAALDESLETIDQALDAVRAALQDDPSSELLARLLANHQRSKLRVLRQAALSVQAQS